MFSKNVLIIYLNQVLCTVGLPVVLILGGLVSVKLAPSEAYATLPIFALQIGTALFLLPSGRIMKRRGRKFAFLLGSAVGIGGSILLAIAMRQLSFPLFCAGAAMYGLQNALVKQFRFAVAEELPSASRGLGISMLISSGLLAAMAGPALVNAFPSIDEYANVFLLLVAMNVVSFLTLLAYTPKPLVAEPVANEVDSTTRGVKDYSFVSTKRFLVPSMLDATAFVVMTLLMTVTPVQMTMHAGCSVHQASDTIMWHLVFMYLPAFGVGWSMKRFGVPRTVLLGYGVFIVSILLLLSSEALLAYKAGLALVGVGWNCLYLTSTALNDSSFSGSTRFLAQSAHEFVTMLFQCASSLFGAVLLVRVGWTTLNTVSLCLLALTGVCFQLSRRVVAPRAAIS